MSPRIPSERARRYARAVRRSAAIALFAFAGAYALFGGEYPLTRLIQLRRQAAAEAREATSLKAEIQALRIERNRLRDDPAVLEAVARERFGLIRPGEVLYRFAGLASGDSLSSGR